MDAALASAIVGRHYPERSVVAVDPIPAGNRPTAVVRFRAHEPLVVQLSTDIDAVRTETALVAAVRAATDVPVPPTLATGSHADRAYAISEFRPGTDLHAALADAAPSRRRDIARQFGRYLGELHAAFTFGACGELRYDEAADALQPAGAERDDWLAGYGRRAVERLPPEFDPLRGRLYDCLQTAPAGTAPPRLFPWDLRPGNALLDDDELSAVLDWERPMAAPAALSLAKTSYLVADWYVAEPGPLRRVLRQGYAAVRPLPTVRPIHRVVAVADSAVDSRGAVTNPGYPERDREGSVAFHRAALERVVGE